MTPPLTLVQLQPLARSLSRRIARRAADVDDLTQEALFAAHRNLPEIRRARKPYALARTVMQRAAWGFYEDGGAHLLKTVELDLGSDRMDHQRLRPAHVFAVDPGNPRAHYAYSPAAHADAEMRAGTQSMMFDEFFADVERCCGPAARRIAENLVAPGGECAKSIMFEVRRKQQERRCGNKSRGVEREVRVSHRMVREGLGLTKREWARTMTVLRAFTARWLADR